MKKKLILSFILALVMVFSVTGALFANELDLEVEAPEEGYQGDDVTVTVTVTAIDTQDSRWDYPFASAGHIISITDPDGVPVVLDADGNIDIGSFPADASYTIEYTFTLEELGEYLGNLFATAIVDWDFEAWSEAFSILCKARPMPVYDWYNNGQFEIAITSLQTSHRGYLYLPDSSGAMIVSQDVIQFGMDVAGSRTLRVDLPAGTTVTDENGDPVYKLLIIYHEYYGIEPYIEFVNAGRPGSQLGQEINFSNPLVISKTLGGGDLKEIISVSTVHDGRVDL